MKIDIISQNVFEGHFPVNWFFDAAGFNGQPALVGTPGSTLKHNLEMSVEVRGGIVFRDHEYWVIGDTVYKDGVTALSGTLNTSTGVVSIATSPTHIMIVDGSNGYYISYLATDTLSDITDSDFPDSPLKCCFTNSRFVVVDGDNFYWGYTINSPVDWDASFFNSPNGKRNCSLSLIADHGELFIFGDELTKIYYPSADYVFAEFSSGIMELGIDARNSVAKIDNTVFWFASDKTVRKVSQYVPIAVSPPRLNEIFKSYNLTSDAIGFSFPLLGYSFYCLIFPSEGVTWLFNIATNSWCQWACGNETNRHFANCCVYDGDDVLIGHYNSGKVSKLDPTVFADDGNIIRCERITPVIRDPETNKRLVHKKLTLLFKMGVGLITGQGSDPFVMVSYSDDECRTWSNEYWLTLGKIGEYSARAIKRRLGSSRTRNYKLAVTDPVERTLYGAIIE